MSDVLDFMKGQVGRVFNVREISEEVDEARFKRDKTWASHELKGLCNKGFIEAINGCYWIPPHQDEEDEEVEGEPEQEAEKHEDGENKNEGEPVQEKPQ